MTRRLIGTPLAPWERDGVKTALVKARLPADDIQDERVLVWRFETVQAIPVGFGGLEIFGSDALLRSLVTLPPLRQVGMGAAMVAMLETEARALKCRVIYLLTASDTRLFGRLGYAACARNDVPEAVRASRQFAALCPPSAIAMVKHIG
jgi:amino-acid N-acetyltransferase